MAIRNDEKPLWGVFTLENSLARGRIVICPVVIRTPTVVVSDGISDSVGKDTTFASAMLCIAIGSDVNHTTESAGFYCERLHLCSPLLCLHYSKLQGEVNQIIYFLESISRISSKRTSCCGFLMILGTFSSSRLILLMPLITKNRVPATIKKLTTALRNSP